MIEISWHWPCSCPLAGNIKALWDTNLHLQDKSRSLVFSLSYFCLEWCLMQVTQQWRGEGLHSYAGWPLSYKLRVSHCSGLMEASSHRVCWYQDALQGVNDSRSFSRMSGLLDSSWRFGVNFKTSKDHSLMYTYKGCFGPAGVFHNARLGPISTLEK